VYIYIVRARRGEVGGRAGWGEGGARREGRVDIESLSTGEIARTANSCVSLSPQLPPPLANAPLRQCAVWPESSYGGYNGAIMSRAVSFLLPLVQQDVR